MSFILIGSVDAGFAPNLGELGIARIEYPRFLVFRISIFISNLCEELRTQYTKVTSRKSKENGGPNSCASSHSAPRKALQSAVMMKNEKESESRMFFP